MVVYDLTREDLGESADQTKALVLEQLVRDGLIDEKIADEWCAEHTIIFRKKTIFRTVSTLFCKKEEAKDGNLYQIVVKAN